MVEAVTIRYLCAQGILVFNKRALNRLTAASTAKQPLPALGDPIVLDRAAFVRHVGVLCGFARSMADGVANLPDVP